ncbi:MAG: histidinol-phosphate transaminase [Deltaproteobacteria bacterium]|nr:histidinol-phosphate transaminase [Deltaproteobacteria bacterium]
MATTHTRKGFLRLDMNESVEGLPESFVREVLDNIKPENIASYPEYDEITAMIAASFGLAPENVLVSNGSDAAIKHLFEAYVDVDDNVLLTDPTFAMYPVYSKIVRAREVAVPYNDDLSFPFDAFRHAIEHSRPKLAVVVNPNNPTGSKLEQTAIRSLAVACRKQDSLLVVDEAYFHYLEETAVALVPEFDNVVILRTFSKLSGLAGLRIGYALAHAEVISAMGKVKSTFDVNCLAVVMATALLARPEILRDQLASVGEGKRWLLEKLDARGISCVAGHANFVLIDCGERCTEVAEMLKKDNILVGAGFSQPFLKKYLRVTVAGPEIMKQFWQSFARFDFNS